jgi:sigma-E factor negative regulatory protein RseB
MVRKVPLALAAWLAFFVAPVLADPARNAEEAKAWIARMSEALATRNYDGLFTHQTRHQTETMRIVHRMQDGRSVERLVSLDGSGREIITTTEEVHCYMPDRRMVLVEPRNDRGSLINALPLAANQSAGQYTFEMKTGKRILGRDVRLIEVKPRDRYRYGYRLWLDEESGMPLRSQVCDEKGVPIEQIHFTRLDLPEQIDAKETGPGVDATGFRWMRAGQKLARRPVTGPTWRAARVPPGFRLVGARLQPVPGVPVPAQHLIFSDGFASVSVFIEPGPPAGPSQVESSTIGSSSAFSTRIGGHVVTAVGEVPPTTVRFIATSVAPPPSESESPPTAPAAAAPAALAPSR